MADSIPYGRQIVYYSSKAALPTLTALIFLASVGELFVQFLQWFLPLLGEGMYRAHQALERSQYINPVWRDSAPIVEAEPFEWPDLKGMLGRWWGAVIGWMKRCLAMIEGWLDKMGGGGGGRVTPYSGGGGFGGGSAVVKARGEFGARLTEEGRTKGAHTSSTATPTRSATTSVKQITPPRPPRRIASSSSSRPAGSVKAASVGSLGSGRGSGEKPSTLRLLSRWPISPPAASNPFAAQRKPTHSGEGVRSIPTSTADVLHVLQNTGTMRMNAGAFGAARAGTEPEAQDAKAGKRRGLEACTRTPEQR